MSKVKNMTKFPPEKYYEACITYHLVTEFQQRLDQILYPISISQIKEHIEGYDFGYHFSSKSFFVQYKRPIARQNDVYCWDINKEQLQIINMQNNPCRTYYALPAFTDIFDWYQGINMTYFIQAPKLALHLRNSMGEKTTVIRSDSQILRSWEDVIDKFAMTQNSVSILSEHKTLTSADILRYSDSLSDEIRMCTWGYLLEE